MALFQEIQVIIVVIMIVCHFYEIHRVLSGFKEYSDPVKWAIAKSEIRCLHQVISHIKWHEFVSIRRQIRTNSDYKNERFTTY